MATEIAITLTFRSIEELINVRGGSYAWKLSRQRARLCKFVVCARNAKDEQSNGPEAHGSAFLVGRLSDVVPVPERPGRYLLQFSEYALVDVPGAWGGHRNPLRYATTDDIDLDFDALDWKPMPPRPGAGTTAAAVPPQDEDEDDDGLAPAVYGDRALTMAEAKRGLAMTFGVAPEAIEITVRF